MNDSVRCQAELAPRHPSRHAARTVARELPHDVATRDRDGKELPRDGRESGFQLARFFCML